MQVEKVFCPSKAEHGELCGYELIPRFNVCPNCGANVDKSWFRRGAEFSDVHLDKNGNTYTSASSESGNPVTQNEDKNSNIGREILKSGEKENAETKRKESAKKEIVGRGEEGLKGERVQKGRENTGNRKRKKGEDDEDNNGGKSKDTRKEVIKEEAELEKEENLRKQQETHGVGDEKVGRGGSREETRGGNENHGSQRDQNNKKEEDQEAGRMTGTENLGNGSNKDTTNKEEDRERTISDPKLRSSAEGATNPSDITIVNQEFPVSKEKEHLDKQNTQTSNKTGEQSNDSNDSQTKKTVKVCFYAFLAPTVDFNQKRDQLFVVFGPERDNWNCKKEGIMKYTVSKSKKKYGIPVFAEIELEKDLLKNNGLSYRYCFQRKVGGSNKSQEETEFLFQKFYPYSTNCRMLAVPPHLDYYQQYDGFIYVKKGGYIINLFKDTFGISNSAMVEVMKKDGEHALKQYLPNVCGVMESPDQDPSTIITAVTKYCQVFQGGVKDQFMTRPKYRPELWKQFIMEDHLRHAIEALNNHANKTDGNGRLLKALLMVKLLVDLNINMDFLDYETVEIMHHSLLLAPDTEHSFCPQLEFLKACFVKPSLNK